MSTRAAPRPTARHRFAATLLAAAFIGACGDETIPSSTGTGGSSATVGAGGGTGGTGAGAPPLAACDLGTVNTPCNPFGVSLTLDGFEDMAYLDLVTGILDAAYYRPPPIPLGAFAQNPKMCSLCDRAAQRHLGLVLVVRNAPDSLSPSTPPDDVDAYEKALGAALDRWAGSLAAVVIEDEVGPGSTLWGGTTGEYLSMLRVGCEVAHGRGVRCANAGIAPHWVSLLLADYYHGVGYPKEASRILLESAGSTALSAIVTSILQKPSPDNDADVQQVLSAVAPELETASQLLAGYAGAGVDFSNFHWLDPGQDTIDEVIAFMRTKTGCNAIISDLLGQRNDDPVETKYKLDEGKELGLPLVIWWSEDAADTRSLVDPSGALRPTGVAFELASETAECE